MNLLQRNQLCIILINEKIIYGGDVHFDNKNMIFERRRVYVGLQRNREVANLLHVIRRQEHQIERRCRRPDDVVVCRIDFLPRPDKKAPRRTCREHKTNRFSVAMWVSRNVSPGKATKAWSNWAGRTGGQWV